MHETMILSKYVSELSYDALPADVIIAAKNCILDYMGCALFATQTDMGKIIADFCRQGNTGRCTILPDFHGKYDATFAGLANGTFAHGFELDDIDLPSISHPGAAVIPAALALAEERGVSGKRFLEAIVVGYEIMSRVGRPIAAPHLERGHHPTGTFGTYGATAACCKILGLDAERTAWAFGIAGSLASGLAQFSISGSMVKRIHAGKSAQQGVMSAKLAEKGYTGPIDILEGKLGFCRTFRGDTETVNLKALTDDLGKTYAITDTTVKPSAACGVLHAPIECIQKIRAANSFEPDDIEKIVVRGHHNLVHAHNVYEPTSILSAQYSLPFNVGMCLLGDIEDPSPYLSDEILNNQAVIALGRKVSTEMDDEIESLFPAQFGGKVDIYLKNGQVLQQAILHQKGSAGNPFTPEELYRKYYKLAITVIPEATAEELGKRIKRIDTFADIDELYKWL